MLFFSEVHNNTIRETNQAFSCFISRSLLSRTAVCFELGNGGNTSLEVSTSFVGQILLPQTGLLRQHFLNFSFNEICSGSCSQTLKRNAESDSTLSVSFMHFGAIQSISSFQNIFLHYWSKGQGEVAYKNTFLLLLLLLVCAVIECRINQYSMN